MVHFKGAWEDNESLHLVMEYCRGGGERGRAENIYGLLGPGERRAGMRLGARALRCSLLPAPCFLPSDC